MSKITRVTQPIFAAGATNNGQFGSAQAGTKVLTNDLATIMALSAFGEGWLDAVLGASKFPPLEEFQALDYVITTQLAYIFQEGISEYDSGTTYFENSVVKQPGTFNLYGSIIDNNTGNLLTDVGAWKFLTTLGGSTGTLFTGSAPTGGTANAQTLTTTAGTFTLTAGNIVDFVAGHTNTGATTLAVDGTAATTIKKQGSSGLIDLVAGDITSTQSYVVVFDGVYFELQSAFNPAAYLQVANNLSDLGNVATAQKNLGISPPNRGAFSNLKGSWVSNTTATFTADVLTVATSSGTSTQLQAYSKTVDSGVTGAGGLSTGALAASTWYAVYAIYNPASPATSIIIDPSFTTPTLPSGYTQYALIGAVKTDGSSNFLPFTQLNSEAAFGSSQALVNTYAGNTNTPTLVSLTVRGAASFIPPNASHILMNIVSISNDGSGIMIAPNNSGWGAINSLTNPAPFRCLCGSGGLGGSIVQDSTPAYMLLQSNSIFYANGTPGSGASNQSINLYGYKLNL